MKRWFWGIVFIVLGGVLLLRNVFDIDIHFWGTLIPILLIGWGLSMLMDNLKNVRKM
jgi:hypothetical protein